MTALGIIPRMKYLQALAFAALIFLAACQQRPTSVIIIDGENIRAIRASERQPVNLLAEAGIVLQPDERVLFNGIPFPPDQALPQTDFMQLQIRRAVILTFVTPQGQKAFPTSALTVGQALYEAGLNLTVNDFLDPPAETPLTGDLTVRYQPARELNIVVGGRIMKVYSAKPTVGEALAEAGIPLTGADYASPSETDALPEDGNIRVTRVSEAVSMTFEALPFETERIEDANLPRGQEELVQAGVKGLALIRSRIRYEDGAEVSRATEEKTVLRAPQKQIVKSGAQIVTADINGLDYWHVTEMYATVYSPCASGTGKCSYGTASGARAGYGVVAVDSSVYRYLAGTKVYVPGYGVGTIGDVGGGSIIEANIGIPRAQWIDLGFDDGSLVNMTGWVTVYFLAPAPAEIPPFLK